MNQLKSTDFAKFFKALHDFEPFTWQKELAESACKGNWPDVLALPTASGKTACIDIALFALAFASQESAPDHRAPRRIFFVVDRRVIVDEAANRVQKIADKLFNAEKENEGGTLKEVARILRELGGTDSNKDGEYPLDFAVLRGGVYRDDAWARTPTKPTVICTTVDQIGSRLLFRSYGCGQRAWPIHAGLAGNDALILLDEAHIAQPFMQTVQAIKRYREWSSHNLQTPFHFVLMSATPPSDAKSVFPQDSDMLLKDGLLAKRLEASKPAELAIAKPHKHLGKCSKDPLVQDAAQRALELAEGPAKRIAVMVNRVATAKSIYKTLEHHNEQQESSNLDVVLFTGRMRPIDKDRVTKDWSKKLRANKPDEPDKPVIVVTTQCLEVGADFSFDALITECASLDALRQRFGRLNRLGNCTNTTAVILTRKEDAAPKKGKVDPIYGKSLPKTWHWLNDNGDEDNRIDMGINALEAILPEDVIEREGLFDELNAPARNAPVMLPAYVDMWAQTNPVPKPSPDVALFLHGPCEGAKEVQVCWRADITREDLEKNRDSAIRKVIDTLALCPPSSLECLPVPLTVFHRWIKGGKGGSNVADVAIREQVEEEEKTASRSLISVFRWRGPEDKETEVITYSSPIRPGDLFVIPASAGGWETFGHVPGIPDPQSTPGEDYYSIDVGDWANYKSRRKAILRVKSPHPAITDEQIKKLREACDEEDGAADWKNLLRIWADSLGEEESDIRTFLRQFNGKDVDCVPHPLREHGVVIRKRKPVAKEIQSSADETFTSETFTSEDDSSSATSRVTLAEHSLHVEARTTQFTRQCRLPDDLQADIAIAAKLHDLGKADPRFQAWLHGGNLTRAKFTAELLGKSDGVPLKFHERIRARKRCNLPVGFRHELVSVRLAEKMDKLMQDAKDPDLVLHLIASHHGYCRPFAPAIEDPHQAAIDKRLSKDAKDVFLRYQPNETSVSGHGLEQLDSGVAERFWRLVRKYGWWGLAYLETIMRLADHRASEAEELHQDKGHGQTDAEIRKNHKAGATS